MPFVSPKQELWMRVNKPQIWARWVAEYGHAKGYFNYLKKRGGTKKKGGKRGKKV